MKAYLSVMKLRFLLLLQYRWASSAGVVTWFFFGLIRVMVLEAFYSSGSATTPMSFVDAVSYTWLGQTMLGLLPWDGDREVQSMVRTGNVAYELCRPVDVYSLWFARCLAHRIAPTLMRAVPIFLTASLLMPAGFRLRMPDSPVHALAWVVSTMGAVILSTALSNIYHIAVLWTVSGEGISRMLPSVVIVLSGMAVPLTFYPDWLQPLLRFLPFGGLVDTPFRFYLGLLPMSHLLPSLIHQLAWAGAFVLFGRWLVAMGLKQVVVQGG